MTLTARHALVTGGSRALGRAVALSLAHHGVHVGINYIHDEASARETLEQVRARGADGFTVQADVSKPEQAERLFERVRAEFGGLDIFVANAGTDLGTFNQPTTEMGPDEWDLAMDSQAKAFLVGVGRAAAMMPDGGRVIAITGALGERFASWERRLATGAAKSALEMLCRSFALALAPRGITVNAIRPGWTDDSGLNTLPEAIAPAIRDHDIGWTPMRRPGTPADIGSAVALFCSREAGWITGQIVAVDGGMGLMDAAVPLALQQPDLEAALRRF